MTLLGGSVSSGAMHVETWTHLPTPPLDRWIESMWLTLSAVPLYRRLRVFPDGRMIVMFNLGGAQGVLDERGHEQNFRQAWICGSFTRPLEVVAGADHKILGVRFRPGGAQTFFAEDAAAFTDRVVELETLWGTFPGEVCERLQLLTPARAFALIESALRARMRADRLKEDLVRAALGRLIAARGNVRVGEVADELGVSRRHLARSFTGRVGLSPKVAARVFRFQSMLAQAIPNDEDWGALARRFGFYDQAHFTHEFRAFAGMTPTAYAAAIKADGEGVVTA